MTVASDSTGVLSVDDNGATLSVDDGGGSLTIDASSLPLPSGASTAAKQPALGTAGAASADVLSVQGVASMTALKVDGSGVTQPVSGTVTANLGTAAVTNAGTFVTQENGSALTSLQLLDDTIVADDAAFTVGTTKVTVAGFLADQASTDSVNEGDAGAARMTLDRKQIVTVAPSADTEGLTIFRSLDLDETEEDVKTSAGKLYGWYLYNDGAAEVYVKLYNAAAASVTVGTTTPVLTLPVPAGAAANVEFANGIAFSTAICAAATTAVADNDTGAPAANQVIANFFYQ